ncbi:MAG: multidrug efflux SMR transporter [Desulfovibrio sp.]|jgi:small multidrug resistance pump|nr:multidrug efflux SMR transporter [Desulfovibrio sp.]
MTPSVVAYGSLLLAIFSEITGTTMLKQSEQFSRLTPSILCVASYSASFYFLSIAIKVIPIGIAYALWSGVGIVAISVIGVVLFKQYPDGWAIVGMVLIVSGVIVVNLSKSMPH